MTAPDRSSEPLIDAQGNVNSGVARVRCVSLARAVVELLEALDICIIALETAGADGEPGDMPNAQLENARQVIARQRSRFNL